MIEKKDTLWNFASKGFKKSLKNIVMKRKKGMFDKQKEKHRKKKHHFIPPNFFFLRKMAYLLKEKEGKVLEIKMYFSALKKFFFSHKKRCWPNLKKNVICLFSTENDWNPSCSKNQEWNKSFSFPKLTIRNSLKYPPSSRPHFTPIFSPQWTLQWKNCDSPCKKMTIFSTENLNYAHKYPKWAFCCGWTTMNIRCK